MKSSCRLLLLLTLGLQGPGVFAGKSAVQVVDANASPQTGSYPAAIAGAEGNRSGGAVGASNSALAEMLYQVELLRQEVQELRGIVDQQSWQIKQMGEEQRDRYTDLDRRFSLLDQPGVVSEPAADQSMRQATRDDGSQAIGDESAYQAAFDLIRNKRYNEAITALQQFTRDYPRSALMGNVYYWLGEVQLVKANYQEALAAFEALLTQHPNHRKVPDAKYKLSHVHRELGHAARAKQLLQEVVTQHAGTSAAKLAEAELRN